VDGVVASDEPVVLAVDGNSLVHRSYHAQARTGQPSWAVRGLLTQLVAAVERVRPSVVVVGFDDPDRSWRREQWPTYKAHRTEKLETLVEQLADAVQALRELGVAVIVPDGLEADDVLASAAACARRAGAHTVVVSSDRDAFALIDDTTRVLRIIDGGVDASPMMTPARLVALLGVRPDQYRDFAALRGDPSDNLPGVRGIGPRTAARLLAEFGCAAAAFDDLDRVRRAIGAGFAARLGCPEARAAFDLNCAVMAMRTDVPIDLDLTCCAGALPLDGTTVDAVFRSHNLIWTAADAVRVLAEIEPDALSPVEPEVVGWWPTAPVRRLPPLRPTAKQLSLFD
jgi:DNA polymerase-1